MEFKDEREIPRLCVFTPTYNRASTLINCYKCLLKQTNQDFQWLIIDDGSTDQTESIVQKWIGENIISIQYVKKSNQGKVRAIEDSLQICEAPMWLCLDSDDELFSDAVEKILDKYDEIFSDEKCCGVYGVRYTKDRIPMQGEQYIEKIEGLPDKVQFMEARYKYRIAPEYCMAFKVEILKKYGYPHFDGEKFIPESSVYCLMDVDEYYYLTIKTPVMSCEYLEDGLSKNYYKNVASYPKGYTYTQGVIVDNCKYLYGVIRASMCYQTGRILGGDLYEFKNDSRRVIASIMRPAGFMLWLLRYKKIKDRM